MKNEILEEVWRTRDEFARRHDYDLEKMTAALRRMERRPWSKVVSREKKGRGARRPAAPPPASGRR